MLEMANPPLPEAFDRHAEFEGVRYLLTARRLATGWFGSWSCCRCGKRGVDGVLYATPSAALDFTAKNMGPHRCPSNKK